MDLPVWMTGMGLAGHQKPLSPGPAVMSTGPATMTTPTVGYSPAAPAPVGSSPNYLPMFQPNPLTTPNPGSTVGNGLNWSPSVMPPVAWDALSDESLLPPGPMGPASAAVGVNGRPVSGSVVSAMSGGNSAGGDAAEASLADGMSWGATPFMDRAKVVLGGIGTLANIWSAWQANKLARDSLDFQKKAYKTNLENTTKSYNTQLEDRAASRASFNPDYDAQGYLDRNRLGG